LEEKEEEDEEEEWTSDAKKAFAAMGNKAAKKKKPTTLGKINLLKLHGSMSQKDRLETFRFVVESRLKF
jgi:hypothetical protein